MSLRRRWRVAVQLGLGVGLLAAVALRTLVPAAFPDTNDRYLTTVTRTTTTEVAP